MNANLIFKWLKDPRFAPEVVDAEAEPAFLPIEISPAVSHREPEQPSGLTTPGGRIDNRHCWDNTKRVAVNHWATPARAQLVLRGVLR